MREVRCHARTGCQAERSFSVRQRIESRFQVCFIFSTMSRFFDLMTVSDVVEWLSTKGYPSEVTDKFECKTKIS